MTERERTEDYIVSLESGHGSLCDEIARTAREEGVPIIRPGTAALLKTLVTAVQPSAILEVGTAIGYSALLMAQAMPEACVITTIEKYEKRILFRLAVRKRNKENLLTEFYLLHQVLK